MISNKQYIWYLPFFRVCMWISVDYKRRQRVKNKKYDSTRNEVEWCDRYSLHVVTSSAIYYSIHAQGKCSLFVSYKKSSNDLLKIFSGMFGAWKKTKNKSADVIWRVWRRICACHLADHRQSSRTTTNEKAHDFFFYVIV